MSSPKRVESSVKSIETLRLSEERFRLLIDSVKDYAIFMLTPEGIVATWNAGAQRFKGYRAEEIIGRHFSTFYTQLDRDAGKPARELEIAAREGRYEEEGWRVRKDGTVFWANVVISAMRSEDGALYGFAKVTRDLTERRAHEEQLKQAVAELTKSNRELDEYASFVSHDLQEPLRKMASFAQLLELEHADKLDGDAKQYLRNISDGAVRMRALITDVLDYARIGRAEPPMAEVDLGKLADAVVHDLELQIKEAGARVELGPLPRVRGNRERLGRVLQNLFSNALKYRDPARAPVVKVRARREGREWVVAVEDNGIGFDPKYADKILRPFQRLHPKEKYPGSGIGLASSKKIVDMHGGRLRADSEPGKGSTFYLTLPAEAR